MIQNSSKNPLSISDSPLQFLDNEETMVYRKGALLILYDLTSNSQKNSIDFGDQNIFFFRVFEDGPLSNTAVVLSDTGLLIYHNVATNK